MYDNQSLLHDPKKQILLFMLFALVVYWVLILLQGRAEAVDMVVEGDRGYVGWGSAGVGVMNLKDPSEPIAITLFDTAGKTRSIALNTPNVFVADGNDGVRILDFSQMDAPVEVSFFKPPPLEKSFLRIKESGSAEDVAINRGFAYIAYGKLGVEVVDVANLIRPNSMGRLTVKGNVNKVVVDGNYGYLGCGRAGVAVIDISSPNAPRQVGENFDTRGTVYNIAVYKRSQMETYLLVSNGTDGLLILSVNDITKPKPVSVIRDIGTVRSAVVRDNLVYLATGQSGMAIFDISDISKPRIVAKADTQGYAYKVVLISEYAYILDGYGGIHVFNIADPVNIKPRIIVEFPGKPDTFQYAITILLLVGGVIFWSIFFSQFVLPIRTLHDRVEAARHFWLYWLGEHGPATLIQNGIPVDRPPNMGEWGRRLTRVIHVLGTVTWPFSWLLHKMVDSILGLGSGVIVMDAASGGVLRSVVKHTRPIGPGVVFTDKFETLAGAVDLRLHTQFVGPRSGENCFLLQGENESAENYKDRKERCLQTSAFTRDGIEVIPNVIAIFRLKSKYRKGGTEFGYQRSSTWKAIVHEGVNPSVPIDAAKHSVPWNELPAYLAIDLWREYIRKYTLNELFERSVVTTVTKQDGKKEQVLKTALDVITTEIRVRMTRAKAPVLTATGEYTEEQMDSPQHKILQQRGIEVLTVVLTNLQLPKEVDEQIAQRWRVRWDKQLSLFEIGAGQTQRKEEIEAEQNALINYALWSSRRLAERLSTIPEVKPDVSQTLILLLESMLEESQKNDIEMYRQMGDDRKILDEVIERIRSY